MQFVLKLPLEFLYFPDVLGLLTAALNQKTLLAEVSKLLEGLQGTGNEQLLSVLIKDKFGQLRFG